jgi:hypothetical protein
MGESVYPAFIKTAAWQEGKDITMTGCFLFPPMGKPPCFPVFTILSFQRAQWTKWGETPTQQTTSSWIQYQTWGRVNHGTYTGLLLSRSISRVTRSIGFLSGFQDCLTVWVVLHSTFVLQDKCVGCRLKERLLTRSRRKYKHFFPIKF